MHHPSAIHRYFRGAIFHTMLIILVTMSDPKTPQTVLIYRVKTLVAMKFDVTLPVLASHLPRQKAHVKSQSTKRLWCEIRESISLRTRGEGIKVGSCMTFKACRIGRCLMFNRLQAFDDLLLMKVGGYIIYHGPLGRNSTELVKYFEVIIFFSRLASHQS